ncbi:MAG: four helix bundle protein [Flavisolibacter sp.]
MAQASLYKGFKELDCWKKGRELRIKVSDLVKFFPHEEKYMLAQQIRRSARSVTNNIAEGYGRFTFTDTKHFFIQARGSVTETLDHLMIALEENYIGKEKFDEMENLCETLFRLINGYIHYLDKKNGLITKASTH